MKKIAFLLAVTLIATSCSKKDDSNEPQNVPVHFLFTQNWDGDPIENADYETTDYINEHGETLKLSKLVYLISDITFRNASGEVFDAGDYNLIDARESTNIHFVPNIEIPTGTYNVSFTFGFDNEDNAGNYPDLNSADGGWNVPLIMGGGYHYMRMEGKYTSPSTGTDVTNFQYHAIRANDNTVDPLLLTDTSFVVDLGEITITDDLEIEIKMNVAEWFKNPNTWDLNLLHEMLMPNYDAQIMMSGNGANGVFSLGSVGPHVD
ncbi:MAG: MbnP family protein [Flavobacteriaceae bacterium]